MKQTGLYIHIPFCVRKCNYCDFLSFSSTEERREQYVDCLCREIQQAKTFFPNIDGVDTIFIGGGTPSMLSGKQMERILETTAHTFSVDSKTEITMECNPGTVTEQSLRQYRTAGINRLSIGVQSLQPDELQALGRIHTREEAMATYHMARDVGFENINMDLMSGIPKQSLTGYETTLQEVCQLAPEHISAYSLIIEEGTPFFEKYGEEPPVSEGLDRIMYERTKEVLSFYGYARYEISNYAKMGYESRHNLKYWSGEDYLGVGLGASSKIGNIRYKNESDIEQYLQKIQREQPVGQVEEILSREDEMAEFFILGLRRMKGVSRQAFQEQFGEGMETQYGEALAHMKKLGLLQEQEGSIALTERGIDVSNVVFQQFI